MHISGKISRDIGIILSASEYLNKDGLLALYNAFMYPYITYYNHICGDIYNSNISRLAKRQKTSCE